MSESFIQELRQERQRLKLKLDLGKLAIESLQSALEAADNLLEWYSGAEVVTEPEVKKAEAMPVVRQVNEDFWKQPTFPGWRKFIIEVLKQNGNTPISLSTITGIYGVTNQKDKQKIQSVVSQTFIHACKKKELTRSGSIGNYQYKLTA